MAKKNKDYSHIVEFDSEKRVLQIFRLHKDGSRTFYTETKIPDKSFDDDECGFREFAKILGENILADSPSARKLLKI